MYNLLNESIKEEKKTEIASFVSKERMTLTFIEQLIRHRW